MLSCAAAGRSAPAMSRLDAERSRHRILGDLVVGLTGKNLVEQVCLFFAQPRFQLMCAALHDG